MRDTFEYLGLPNAAALDAAQGVLDHFAGTESPLACPQDFSAALAAWCSAAQTVEGIAYDAQGSQRVEAPRTPQQVSETSLAV